MIRSFIAKNRSLLAMGAAALFAELAYAILNLSALPMYVKFTLHEEAFWGMILSAFLLTEAISRPPLGALGDRIGRKPLMIAGPAITAVTAYLTIVLRGPFAIPGLVLLRVIDGLGSGGLWMNAFAAVGDITEEKNHSTAMSMLNVTYMGGMALGFLMGGAVNDYFGTYTASFYLVSILLVMSVLTMLFLLPRHIGEGRHVEIIHGEPLELPIETPARFKIGDLVRSFREVPDMVVLAVVTFLGMGTLTPIVKLYAIEHLGVSETQFGIMVAPIAAAMGILAVPMGRVGDKYGKCFAVCWGLLVSAMAMWVLALFRSIFLAGIAGIAIGIGFTMAFPAWNALIISITTPERRGEVMGAVGLAQGLAVIVGAIPGAYIYSSDFLSFPRLGIVNYNVPFWISAVLLSAGTLMAFTWVRARHCHRDPRGGVTIWQRNTVVVASIVGFAALAMWIGIRYARPVPPDRVAWQWVQQLFRGRPEKSLKFIAPGWNGAEVSKAKSRLYTGWRKKQEARYTVKFAHDLQSDLADVPVRFILKGNKIRVEHVMVCRQRSGNWKVCGVSPAR